MSLDHERVLDARGDGGARVGEDAVEVEEERGAQD
jgi:hypothetical protein